jgi:predicted metal-dependent phosphotriesterase family hydrolase
MKHLFFLPLLFSSWLAAGQKGFVNTVKGKISSSNLSSALTHEHIMSHFGAPASRLAVYDSTALFKQVIPYLKKIKQAGIASIFDCTAAYFGRNVQLLQRIADSTGLHIITNTGFYGAAKDQYIPAFAFTATVKEIAQIWITEFKKGIEDTDIKPGFIKLGFDEGQPSAIDSKLFEAGIATHLKTGLTLVVHTGNNIAAAKAQLQLLHKKKVSPAAWVWAHANKVEETDVLTEAAEKGAWISLDGVTRSNAAEYTRRIQLFRDRHLLHKLLLSHDGNSFPRGGAIRQFEDLTASLVPALLKNGFSADEIAQLLIRNPQAAFEIKIRKQKRSGRAVNNTSEK